MTSLEIGACKKLYSLKKPLDNKICDKRIQTEERPNQNKPLKNHFDFGVKDIKYIRLKRHGLHGLKVLKVKNYKF